LPRQCKVCNHKQLDEINRSLIKSPNISELSRRFDLPWDSLKAHKKNHLPANLVKAKTADEAAEAESLIKQLQDLQDRTLSLLTKAENTRDHNTALRAISEARRNIELLAKITGELQQAGVNVQVLIPVLVEILSSEIHDSRTLTRVADRLQELEDNNFKVVQK
jgi:hypothetical protein